MKLLAFILAAGRGDRLRPITDYIPKPLLPVVGKPVLEAVLERVSVLGVHRIGINVHHKKEDIEKWVRQSTFSDRIEFFPEDPALGTGGALKNAGGFLKKSAFLVHNSDILSDMDLNQLVDCHLSSGNLATLAVHDYPEFNKLEIDGKGLLKSVGTPGKSKNLAFTGIAVYQPEFLKILPRGISSVVDAWRTAIDKGYGIGTFDVTGCRWTDIGTPTSYAKAIVAELRQNGETIYLHPSVKSCKHIEMDGYVIVENKSRLKRGVSLRNCIVLQGSRMSDGSHYENCILGPGFKIDLRESDLFNTVTSGAFLIGTGGSDRKYYRVRRGNRSSVLMQCRKDDPEFERQIEYTRFFRKYSVPVPCLLRADVQKKSASFEDLGDLSLYDWLKCPREKRQKGEIYRRVIDILVLIHTEATEHVSECPLIQERIFDYGYLRWETDYFIERFVCGIRDIRIRNLSALKDEFHRLAVTVDSFRKTLIHRDFQSQNIMMTKGEIPKMLDYQGARIGPPAYDLASILWDPYHRLEDDLREKLVDYYIRKIANSPQFPLARGKPITNSADHTSELSFPQSRMLSGGRESFRKQERFRTSRNDKIIKEHVFTDGSLNIRIGGRMVQRSIFEKRFRDTLLPCRLQRHMQALGAYGFLSSVKGKKYFLKYVPEALRLLKGDCGLCRDEYPELYKLVRAIP